MRSTLKISIAFCGMFVATLCSMAVANGPRKTVNCMADLCHLSKRVEIFQDHAGTIYELNFLDQQELDRFHLSAKMEFHQGLGKCVPHDPGNCGSSNGRNVVILQN